MRPFTGENVFLRLLDQNSGTSWGHIELDAVRLVSLIPEPGTMIMALMGMMVLLGWRRRKTA